MISPKRFLLLYIYIIYIFNVCLFFILVYQLVIFLISANDSFVMVLVEDSYFESAVVRMRSLCCGKRHVPVSACFRIISAVTACDLTLTGKVMLTVDSC